MSNLPLVTEEVSRSGMPLLADLHPVQDITPWHLATTPPPSSLPHARIFASWLQARRLWSSPIPGHTTSQDSRSCLLCAGGFRSNGAVEAHYHSPTTYLLVQVYQPFSPVRFHDAFPQVSLRQQRNQVWSVRLVMAHSYRTVVPGLPTPASATCWRRPGRPYTVDQV